MTLSISWLTSTRLQSIASRRERVGIRAVIDCRVGPAGRFRRAAPTLQNLTPCPLGYTLDFAWNSFCFNLKRAVQGRVESAGAQSVIRQRSSDDENDST